MQQVPSSGNDLAKRQLADVQLLYCNAGVESNAGKVAAASKLLDEALSLIVVTSRSISDSAQTQEHARYLQLLRTVQTFQPLYQNMLPKVPERKTKSVPSADEMNELKSLLNKAAALSAINKYYDANALMANAYNAVVSSLEKMLGAEPIVYDLTFPTPAAEYQYEVARYHSYEELTQIARAQLAKSTERYVNQSHELLVAAKHQAERGEHQIALKTLQEAIGHLQRSLRIAGVVLPQMPEN